MDLSHLFSCALCCACLAVAGDSFARSEQNLWEMSFPEVTLRLLGGKESTKLDWMHLSEEKKAGSEKCVAGQGWLCSSSTQKNFIRPICLFCSSYPEQPLVLVWWLWGKTACWHSLDLSASLKSMSPSFCCNTNILCSVLPLEACSASCWRSVCTERSQGLLCFSWSDRLSAKRQELMPDYPLRCRWWFITSS